MKSSSMIIASVLLFSVGSIYNLYVRYEAQDPSHEFPQVVSSVETITQDAIDPCISKTEETRTAEESYFFQQEGCSIDSVSAP